VNASGPELDQAECPRLVDSGVFLLGALNPPERADYAAHLSRCSACRREVSELADVAALVSRTTSSASATGSGTTSPRVHHHDPARAARTPRRLPPGAVLVLVAAALGGALALGIGLLTRSGTSDHTTRNSP
jgi:anti-sigma factor RsiW